MEEQKLTLENLTPYLVSLKTQLNRSFSQDRAADPREAITIQADKAVTYKHLSPIIQACGHAGFSSIKFAVLGE